MQLVKTSRPLMPWCGMTVALAATVLSAASAPGGEVSAQRRAVVAFFYDASQTHDQLLDAWLTLGLYPHRGRIAYWLADVGQASGRQAAEYWGLDARSAPMLLFLSSEDADAEPLGLLYVRRRRGVDANVKHATDAIQHVLKVNATLDLPEHPAPLPVATTDTERRQRRRVAIKAGSLGDYYAGLGQVNAALKFYRAAAALDDSNAGIHLGLGQMLLDAGQVDEAVTHLQRARALDSGVSIPVLLVDDFENGVAPDWVVEGGEIRVVEGALELRPTHVGQPATVRRRVGDERWTDYRLQFRYTDSNTAVVPGHSPSFACAVRSGPWGEYWLRCWQYGSDVYKRAQNRFEPRVLSTSNMRADDPRQHLRVVEVRNLPGDRVSIVWREDGREHHRAVDSRDPFLRGGIAFRTESSFALIDDVLVLTLAPPTP